MRSSSMILSIYDMDGTLVRSPVDSAENRKLYEKSTGIPWIVNKADSVALSKKHGRHIGMRNGWFGRAESLEPPLVPDPIPDHFFIKEVCDDLLRSKTCKDEVTVIMTGRHLGLMKQVLRILHQGKLVNCEQKNGTLIMSDADVNLLLLGADGPAVLGAGPKPNDGTLPWKMWIIDKFLILYPEIEKVIIWEDRAEHVKEFKALSEILGQEIVVNHVM